MAQIKGLFNEWFAAETSEKVRHVLRSKAEAGQYISKVPYGYKRNPADRHKLVIDEEAATVVRRIFDMMIAGDGYDRMGLAASQDAYYERRLQRLTPESRLRMGSFFVLGGSVHALTSASTLLALR